LPPAAFDQTGVFELPGGIRDGWPLDSQHVGEQVLSDREDVIVAAVTHHEQPTRQPLLEAVRAVARDRHHDLFEKGLDVSVHDTSEGRHRLHCQGKRRARHLSGAPRDLDEKLDRGALGSQDSLHAAAALPADRSHLDDAAVRITATTDTTPLSGKLPPENGF